MPLEIDLQPGEKLVFQEGVKGDRRPIVLGVTNQAVYVTKEQHFKGESWRLERIPIPMVTQVYLETEKRIVPLAFAFFVFTGGFLLALGMWWNAQRELPGTKVSPWPIGFMIIGILIPFFARARKVLVVQEGKKLHKYKPEIFDTKKKAFYAVQARFVEACRSVGITTEGGSL